MSPEFFAGLDLGQSQDYTALAIIERKTLYSPHRDPITYQHHRAFTHDLRHLERIPLGTSYVEVAKRIAEMKSAPELQQMKIAVDATGVGAAVLDQLRAELGYLDITPVLITAGHATHTANGVWFIPKKDLVAGPLIMLERGQLRIAADIPLRAEFTAEMLSIKESRSASGHIHYGPANGGRDDLFIAFTLALWRSRLFLPTTTPQPGALC